MPQDTSAVAIGGWPKEAGLVIAERHGQWRFFRRDEENIHAFLTAVQDELLNP